MLSNLKVGQKILAIVLLVATVLAALLAISYFSFLELRRGLDEVKMRVYRMPWSPRICRCRWYRFSNG